MKIEKTLSYVLMFYVISAIAFECSANTAILSTIGIYLAFAFGVIYIFRHHILKVNIYIISLVIMVILSFVLMILPGASPEKGYYIVYWILTCNVLCIIVYHFVNNHKENVKYILLGNIIGSFVLVIRIIFAYGGLDRMLLFASSDGERRIGSLLLNANSVGLFMANAAICTLLLIVSSDNTFRRILLIFLNIVFSCMCIMAGSKKALIFVAAGYVMLISFYARGKSLKFKIIVFIASVAILAIGIYAVMTMPIFATARFRFELMINTFLGKGNTSYSDRERIHYIETGMKEFFNSPIWGNGTGHSYVMFGTYSHNNFVELFMNYGIIGFSIYYAPYIPLIHRLFRRIREVDTISIYFLTFIVLELFLGYGWVNYYDRTVQIIVAATWGYILSDRNNILMSRKSYDSFSKNLDSRLKF